MIDNERVLLDALRAVLQTDVVQDALRRVENGQGSATEDGKALVHAKRVLAEQACSQGAITWPARRDVARLEDMSPEGHLRVALDADNDVLVEVFDADSRCFASVEFCNPGGGGGGQSRHTRLALIALMRAIEADNAERPSRAHPRFS